MVQTENAQKRNGSEASPHEKRVDIVDIGPPTRQVVKTGVAVMILTLLIHAAVLMTLPAHLFVVDSSAWKDHHDAPYYKIHILQPEPEPDIPPEEQFVQSTDAPENKPDETSNYSDKDQQLSQKMESEDETGDTPEVENAEEEDTNALTTGENPYKQTLQEMAESANGSMDEVPPSENDTQSPDPSNYARQQDPQQQEQQTMQVQMEEPAPPAPAAIAEQDPESEGEGYAEVFKPGEADEIPEEEPDEKIIPAYSQDIRVQMEQPKVDPSDISGAQPKPRPRISLPSAMPTVVRRTNAGLATPNGFVAFDSKMTAFGDYMARMQEVIVTKWYDLNRAGQVVVADSRVYVQVSFYVTKEGQIEDFAVDESTASQLAQWRVKDAVMSNAPYFEWTRDMVDLLGDRQIVRIRFIYR
ncbi:MAG: hypothetical protein JW942_06450 [Opitutales bacterium]|nr:hypothetical protein [Opitutales bacterium]